MYMNDTKVATFDSPFAGGDVFLYYCPHAHRYELRYAVRFRTSRGGVCDSSALLSYDAGDYIQVGDILTDAIELADTSLLERG